MKFLIVSKPSILNLDVLLGEIYILYSDYVMKVLPKKTRDT